LLYAYTGRAQRPFAHLSVNLDEVGECDIYVGLFGNEYGYEDAGGVSPTEREFAHAIAAVTVFLDLVAKRWNGGKL